MANTTAKDFAYLSDLHYEHRLWRNELNFYKEELNILQERELKSLILAQIKRWRHALHMQVERQHGGDLWHDEVEMQLPFVRSKKYIVLERSRYQRFYNPTGSPLAPYYQDSIRLVLPNFALAHQYDDHDGGYNNLDKTYPHRYLALKVEQEYFPVYNVSPYGQWQSFRYGQVEAFVIDARTQRDASTDPDGPNKILS